MPRRGGGSGHGVAAADGEDLAGDLAGGAVGGDPGDGVGDVVGGGEAAQGNVFLQVVDLLLVEDRVLAGGPEAGGADGVGAVGGDQAGADDIGADAVAAVLAGGGAGQGDQGGLGGAVDALADLAEGGVAGDEHDGAGTGLAHGREGGLGAGDGGVEVDLDRALPLGAVGVFGQETGDAPAGVVDQHVDAAPAIQQRGDRPLPRAVGGQIADGQFSLGGAAFEGFGPDLGRLLGVDVGDDQAGPLSGETVHDAAADVRSAPGDQHARVGQAEIHSITPLPRLTGRPGA